MDKRANCSAILRAEDATDSTLLLGELVKKLQAMQRSHGQLTVETQRSMADLEKLRQADRRKLEAVQAELTEERKTSGLLANEVRRLCLLIDCLKKQLDDRQLEMKREARAQETHELIDRVVKLTSDRDLLTDRIGKLLSLQRKAQK
jgi:hypothetical protein